MSREWDEYSAQFRKDVLYIALTSGPPRKQVGVRSIDERGNHTFNIALNLLDQDFSARSRQIYFVNRLSGIAWSRRSSNPSLSGHSYVIPCRAVKG
ncbi:MAG: hypothetical protein ACI9PU_002671 [Ascidiaceihabitans sp.]|jgi:hypothetical protein